MSKADSFPYAYGKSKVLAERAAWEFVDEAKKKGESCLELAVIHPMFILGPVFAKSTCGSVTLFLSILHGKIQKVRNINIPICDVRYNNSSLKLKTYNLKFVSNRPYLF